jgi:hypothetical protein
MPARILGRCQLMWRTRFLIGLLLVLAGQFIGVAAQGQRPSEPVRTGRGPGQWLWWKDAEVQKGLMLTAQQGKKIHDS